MSLDDFTHLVQKLTLSAFTLKQSRLAIEAVIEALRQTILEGDSMIFPGFATFSRCEYNKTQGYNFRTGERMVLGPRNAPKCTFTKSFRDEVAGNAE